MVARAVTALSTIIVTVLVMLAVPVAQLRTSERATACCCPDPDRCQCPDHEPSDGPATMRACHQTSALHVGAQLAAFTAPVAVEIAAPARHVVAVVTAHPRPHPAPVPAQPAAPS